MSLKNPVTLRGIDPGTVRLVTQRLNHYATPGPLAISITLKSREASLTGAVGMNFTVSRPVTPVRVCHRLHHSKIPHFTRRIHLGVVYGSQKSDYFRIQHRLLIFRRVCKSVKGDYWLRHVCMSVRPHGKTGLSPDGFSWKFYIWVFSENLSRKFKFH